MLRGRFSFMEAVSTSICRANVSEMLSFGRSICAYVWFCAICVCHLCSVFVSFVSFTCVQFVLRTIKMVYLGPRT